MEQVKKMIAYGYFAKEIPTEFQSEDLANILDDIKFESLSKKVKQRWAKPVVYTIPKSEDFRRTLSIPSPIHQIQLSQLINEKWSELQDHFNLSTVSMTSPELSRKPDVAIESKIPIGEKMHLRIKHLHNKKYILQTDISRFYPTIYTHVIPWALHTKEYAKENIGNNNLLGNIIDKTIQCMQDGQTFGIPIGPTTSQVVSEIIGTAIDRDFKKLMGFDVQGFRYTDDIEYYFESESIARDALFKLHKVVSEYQLELNPLKTKIVKAPIEFEPEWKQYFTRFRFRKSKGGQKSDINSFFSKAFNYKHTSEDNGILKYAIKKVRGEVIHKENWEIFEALLLHTAFSDSNTLPLVLEVIQGYSIKGYDINQLKLKEFVEEMIKINFPQNNHYEVCWSLVFAKRLGISINSDITRMLLTSDNSIICILTMILYSKKLLDGYVDFSKFKSYLNTEGLYGSNWLFVYEAFRQGWLKPYNNPDFVLEDPFFKILYEKGVSFLRPELDILELIDKIGEEKEEKKNQETRNQKESKGEGQKVIVKGDQTVSEADNPEEPNIGEPIGTKTENPEKPDTGDQAEPGAESQEKSDTGDQAEPGAECQEEPDTGDQMEPDQRKKQNNLGTRNSEARNLLEEITKSSIYKDNEWLFELLNTDLTKENKIKTNLVNPDY